MSRPRIRLRARGARSSREIGPDEESNTALPPTMRAGGSASNRSSASIVTDLPLPLSPTTASVSPLPTEKLTPFTA